MYCTLYHLCNVHAQWANCLPSALINVQSLRVPLSNIWATSEHQVQIRDGTAKNWSNWIFWWILLSRFTIFWLLDENLWFYHNVGISCQNVIIIALVSQRDCNLHSFWLLSVWAGQWFSLDKGRLPKKGFAQFFQPPSTSMWTSIDLGPWLAPVCYHACL